MVKKNVKAMSKKILPLLLVAILIAQSVFSHQNVLADDSVYLEITGYQISTNLEAYRTLYSIADPAGKTKEVGLIYGLTDYITEADMVVGSTNSTVYSYSGTSLGITSVKYSDYEGATTYVKTMMLVKNEAFYNAGISVRAYAKLNDGSYIYSDISTMSVYRIASTLYDKCLMSRISGHNYLYDNILTVVNPTYAKVDYNGGGFVEPKEDIVLNSYFDKMDEKNSSSIGSGTNTIANLFDGDNNTKYYDNVCCPTKLAWQMKEPVVIKQYTLTTANGSSMFPDRNPKTWRLYGSNDATTWKLIDNVEDGGMQAENGASYTYTTDFQAAYKYYTLFIEGNSYERGGQLKAGVWLAEMSMIGDVGVSGEENNSGDIDLIPIIPQSNIELTSLYDGIETASANVPLDGGESVEKLFDADPTTKLMFPDFCPATIAWKMKSPVVIDEYSMTSASDAATYPDRNPDTWSLYGSNDASLWTQIDRVTNAGWGAKNMVTHTYQTDVREPYQYYILNIEDNAYDNPGYIAPKVQLSELSLKGDVVNLTENMGTDMLSHYKSIFSRHTTISDHGSEKVANLFDGKNDTKLFATQTGTISWKMKNLTNLYSYTFVTGNDNKEYPGRNPKSWKLYGSNDSTTWIKLDEVYNSGMADENYREYTFTVDAVRPYVYYKLEVTDLMSSNWQLAEIKMNGSYISSNPYDLLLTGDWDKVTASGYVDELIKLFYTSYPRLYARWGSGSEPKTITFKADSNYDGVAYCAGTTVVVSTDYANANPKDLGFFSHEITHSVQQYGGKLNYGGSAWWTENMANYGGFRYFHWANPEYIQVYQANDTSLQNWGYHPYGNNKWFFAYMDSKYPTTRNADGSRKYGLIDSINNLIKSNSTGQEYNDNPYDTNSPFNSVVRQITGYSCIESLRQRFEQELRQGTWTFKGFGTYTSDNWLTENIDGVPNPVYPMVN